MQYKKKLLDILEVSNPDDLLTKIFSISMILLIILNVFAVILETEISIYEPYKYLFNVFEVFSVGIFTVEYILRIWLCTSLDKFKSPFIGRIKYALTPLVIVDLLAILPFFLSAFLQADLRFVRILRLFRLARILKLARYSESVKLLVNAVVSKKEELIATFFALMIILIFASSLMYYIEHDAQPKAFSSIPVTMWWGISTVTTVGYGDMYPVTIIGKILAGLIMIIGIGTFALPSAIITTGFFEELQRRKKQQEHQEVCPHCGKDINTNE